MNRFSCTTNASNTGANNLCENKLSVVRKLIFCPPGYSIATEASALLHATWLTATKAVKADRIYPFPTAVSVTIESQEDIYQDRPIAGRKFLREGKEQFTLMMDIPLTLLKKLRTFNSRAGSVFLGDEEGNIIGWTANGTTFNAFTIQELHIGKMAYTDGAIAREVPVSVVLRDPREFNDNGAIIQPTWNIYDLDGVYDVVLVASAPSGTGVTVSVTIDSIDPTDPVGQITGLVVADFVLTDDTPTSKTITAVTDNGDGTYHLAATMSADNYIVNLRACSAISLTDIAIESTGSTTFTVS